MTERTYTETEVQAIRAAALREAEQLYINYGPDFNADLADKLRALIDQPAEGALNTMIGAAVHGWWQIANESDGVVGWHRNGDVAEWDELDPPLTPADALAALEQVKRDAKNEGAREAAAEFAKDETVIGLQADAELRGKMAERERLLPVINQTRLALAGYVSAQSAIDMIDAAAIRRKNE